MCLVIEDKNIFMAILKCLINLKLGKTCYLYRLCLCTVDIVSVLQTVLWRAPNHTRLTIRQNVKGRFFDRFVREAVVSDKSRGLVAGIGIFCMLISKCFHCADNTIVQPP